MRRGVVFLVRAVAVLVGVSLLLAAWVVWSNERGEESIADVSAVGGIGAEAGSASASTATTASAPASDLTPTAAPDTTLVDRGAYLARAGNCAGCHTSPGGAPYAGGRGVETPFGTVYASNLTPDPATGLGRWSAAHFWRALHHGRSADGRLLYPAFPYPNYTHVTRADADALWAYLRSLPPATQPNRPHALRFPYDQPAALAVWRALYFRAASPGEGPTASAASPAHDATWRRGAYLVEGLGHCNACHASRNALGATVGSLDLAGGLIPVQNWYAPSLRAADEAGVADWPEDEVVALLRDGIAPRGIVTGPMREVVGGSTQYLDDDDLHAVARYLRALPAGAPAAAVPVSVPGTQKVAATETVAPVDTPGGRLYAQHCAACHGDRGEGVAGIYPPLAGNRAVTLPTAVNLVHLVLEGGFGPSTAGNPRPFGMPPFATVLSDAEVAQVLSHVRGSWGNRAAAVSALDVTQFRRGP